MMNHAKTILVGLSIMAVAVSCQKSGDFSLNGNSASRNAGNPAGEGAPARTMVTINASLPDGGLALAKASIGPRSGNEVILIDDFGEEPETKVSLIQDTENVKVLKPCWESGDKIFVNGVEFTLVSEPGSTAGVFTGGNPGAAPYTISLKSEKHTPASYINQTQASDGSTAHLGYDFTITGASCYGQDVQHAIQFTEDWAAANGATISNQPSILRLRAMMPPSISSAVKKVIFRSSAAVFDGSNTLTVNLTTPGVTSGDNILDVYATLPYVAAPYPTIPDILIQFQCSNDVNDKYSFYHIFNGKVSPGCTHVVNIACTNILNNANRQAKSGSDFVPYANAGTSANPYLIGDQHQLAKVNDHLGDGSSTPYFKLVDDIDMTGVSWGNSQVINKSDPYKPIDFEGNNKTISHLSGALFYNLTHGAVRNLTLDQSSVSHRAILSVFAQQSGNVISNVHITNGSITSANDNTGALVGIINNGTSADLVTATISDCSVSGTTVTVTGTALQVGGLIGSSAAKMIVSDCSVSDAEVSGVKNVGGLIGKASGAGSTVTDCSVSDTDITGDARVGGVMGDAGAAMTVSGCSYADGTITYDNDLTPASGDGAGEKKYFGGVVGFIENHEIYFEDCHVTGTVTIDVSTRVGDTRAGGFVGLNYVNGTIRGCSVGAADNKVLIKTNVPDPTAAVHFNPINAGGFAGVNYGTITKNGETRNVAHAKITSNNTTDYQVNLGGFCGYHRGTIEYSDADADLSGLTGNFIGGFCGRLVDEHNYPTRSRYNSVLGTTVVSGSHGIGGYAGIVNKEVTEGYDPDITVNDCQVASGVTVSAADTLGGFAGKVEYGAFSSSSSAAAVTGGSVLGGFLGGNDTHAVSFNDCQASGNVTSSAAAGQYIGGFVGRSDDFATTYTNCRVRGSVIDATAITSNPITGGFAGQIDESVLVYGCSVGVSGTPVQVNTGNLAASLVDGEGAGGFVGCNYGTITKDSSTSTNTTAYVTLTTTTNTGKDVNMGGFVGYHQGTISYCNADVAITGLQGLRIGGFAGRVDGHATRTVTCDHCTVSASITGRDQLGGFVGRVVTGTVVPVFTNNSVSSGSVVALSRNTGGFVGYTESATYTSNDTYASVSGVDYIGGFVGNAASGAYSTCNARGNVSATGESVGGFVGNAASGAFTSCNARGNVTATGNNIGGFVGNAAGGSFTSDMSYGNVETSGINVGGFVGKSAGSIPYTSCRYTGSGYATSYVRTTCSSAENNIVNLGGFCGLLSKTFSSTIQDCHARSCTVESTEHLTYVGGFFGNGGEGYNANTGSVTQCVVSGVRVYAGGYTGGFAGTLYVNLSRSMVISSAVYPYGGSSGSFVGYYRYGRLENCYTTATTYLQANNLSQIGAFIGIARDATALVYNCYASGTVSLNGKTGYSKIGGFFGQSSGVFDYCVCWNGLDFWGSNNGTDQGHNFTAKNNGGTSGNKLIESASSTVSHWDSTTIWDFTNSDGLPRLR